MNIPGLKELFSTSEERHAFLIGFSEVLCPWPPRIQMSAVYYPKIQLEHHYYLGGRALGVIVWIIIAKLVQVTFF